MASTTAPFSANDPIYALAASPSFADDGLCFAAHGSGLLRSTDGGQSWHDAYGSLTLQAPLTTTCVAFSPDFANDHTVFAGAPGGVLRSTDGGETWTVAALARAAAFPHRSDGFPAFPGRRIGLRRCHGGWRTAFVGSGEQLGRVELWPAGPEHLCAGQFAQHLPKTKRSLPARKAASFAAPTAGGPGAKPRFPWISRRS